MKQGTNAVGFPPKPYTVVRVEEYSPKGAGLPYGVKGFFARNLETGVDGPIRGSYGEAFDDCVQKYAQPWGV